MAEFVETNALIATMEKDQIKLANILRGMTPTELFSLSEACDDLSAEAMYEWRRQKDNGK